MTGMKRTTEKNLMVFSGRAHPGLAEEVAALLDCGLVPTQAYEFANSEIYVRYEESVRGCDAFVIQSHTAPINEWIMEHLIMVDALKRASAKRITVVMPFYGYARQDKKHRGREPISARLIADLLKTAGADRIMSIDLHTAQIQGFFDGPVDHLFALPILAEHVAKTHPGEDITIAFKNKGNPEPGSGAWPMLKFEGGVHRVQRVPVTESQGRIHTSAVGVLVVPEAEEIEIEIHEKDLRVDVYRSSGPGGQSVNTTDSAVRITHLPTGIVASCQNEKSQLQNKEQALRILRARIYAEAQASADAEASAERKSQVRTVDRSERVRTYNFPENRISDHRVGYKAYNLDQVLDGELGGVIKALVDADTKERLEAAQTS